MAKLTNSLPTNLVQLFSVKGVGQKKLEKFGDEILDIIIAYCTEKNLPVAEPEIKPFKRTTKVVVDSKRISFELLQKGKPLKKLPEKEVWLSPPSRVTSHGLLAMVNLM